MNLLFITLSVATKSIMQLCKLTLSLLLSLEVFFVFGQSKFKKETDKRTDSLIRLSKPEFLLPANLQLNLVSWHDSIYGLPSFEYGRVTFEKGHTPKEEIRMNYNIYFKQMDYISANGDTLQIKPSKELKLVTFKDHLYYHDYKIGYVELIYQSPVALGIQKVMSLQRYEEIGGRRLYGGNDMRGTPSIFDRFYHKESVYYFIDKDTRVYKANPSSVYKLFAEHKEKVKVYIDENDLDFENKDHLIELLKFCNGLNQQNTK
jgi:hypothetical protein